MTSCALYESDECLVKTISILPSNWYSNEALSRFLQTLKLRIATLSRQ